MGKRKFTKWFNPYVKPVLPGVYQTNATDRYQGFQHWNGEVWGRFSTTIELANSYEGEASRFQDVKWRGLAEKP